MLGQEDPLEGSPAPSYSKAATMAVMPPDPTSSALDKSKGVLIRRIKGVTLSELLEALGKVISPKKILYADFVTAANFGVWLDTDKSVDDLIGLDTLEIKGQMTKMYRYTNPVHRVVLRNVPPFIPDTVILSYLQKYGEIRGALERQSCYNVGEDFAHVKSFTRNVSLAISDGVIVPPGLTISWENKKHVIYVQVGAKKCFKCNKPGHTSNNCPTKATVPVSRPTPKTSKRKSVPLTIPVEDQGQTESQKRRRFDSLPSQNEGSGMTDSGLDSSLTLGSERPKRRKPGRPPNQTDRSVTRSLSAATVPISSPTTWAFDVWKKGNFKTYPSFNKEHLYMFLRNLKRDFFKGGYTHFYEQVAMATRNPQELHDLLFEVVNSLGKSQELVRTEMHDILKLVSKSIDLSSEEIEKIKDRTDLNFRNFELQAYQLANKLSDDEMQKFRKYFFN